jgi:hypothetical protein
MIIIKLFTKLKYISNILIEQHTFHKPLTIQMFKTPMTTNKKFISCIRTLTTYNSALTCKKQIQPFTKHTPLTKRLNL